MEAGIGGNGLGSRLGAPSAPGVGIVIVATIVEGLGVPTSGIALLAATVSVFEGFLNGDALLPDDVERQERLAQQLHR